MRIGRNPQKEPGSKQVNPCSEELIDEILKMDRLLYLNIIREKGSLTSLNMTREILALKKNVKPEEVKDNEISRKNPNINRRLRDLAEMEILGDQGGSYSLTSLGILISDGLSQLASGIDVIRKHARFFNTHDYTVIPPQNFREIYTLQFAKQSNDYFEYLRELDKNTTKIGEKIRIITDRLHDIPGWIIKEFILGSLKLELIYQFWEPFKVNSNDEEEQNIWRELTQVISPNIEIRYLILKNRNPIGIRIIDQEWAVFNLYEQAEEKLNRPRSFYGQDERFITWIEDIFLNIWNRSESLPISKLSEGAFAP